MSMLYKKNDVISLVSKKYQGLMSDELKQTIKDMLYLSDFEQITIPANSNAPYVAPYNGFIYYFIAGSTGNAPRGISDVIYKNGTIQINISQWWQAGYIGGNSYALVIPVRKGETLYDGSANRAAYARYYKGA